MAVAHLPTVPANGDAEADAGEDVVLFDLRTGSGRTIAHIDRGVLAVSFSPRADSVLAFDVDADGRVA